VYGHLCEAKSGLTAYFQGHMLYRSKREREAHSGEREGLEFSGKYPYDRGILEVCKKTRKDALYARMAAFDGQMAVACDEYYRDDTFRLLCEDKYAKLRGRVTELILAGLSGRSHGWFGSYRAAKMPELFPNVKTIYAEYHARRHRHVDRDSNEETHEWRRIMAPTYNDDFNAGRVDHEFGFPAANLGLHDIADSMVAAGKQCDVVWRTDVDWTDHFYHGVHSQVRLSPLFCLCGLCES
jgi:hypothetical protein